MREKRVDDWPAVAVDRAERDNDEHNDSYGFEIKIEMIDEEAGADRKNDVEAAYESYDRVCDERRRGKDGENCNDKYQ